MNGARFHVGDFIVYRKQKHSNVPGPRAHHVEPEPHGDGYSYLVDKYWVVLDASPHGKITVVTRRNKQHEMSADDPNLRLAHWWERLLYRGRFPRIDALVKESSSPNGSAVRSA